MGETIVVCGAGLAGVSTAFHLTELGATDVVVYDPRPPLTLTSDKSTECYRNWWPTSDMIALMNRSIDLLEQFDQRSNGYFNLNRRGYLYVTADPTRMKSLTAEAHHVSSLGGGPVRVHDAPDTYLPASDESVGVGALDGADLLGPAALRAHFPYLTSEAVGAVHVRRAGWMSAQQLGAWMIAEATSKGARFVSAEVMSVHIQNGGIAAVSTSDGSTQQTSAFVNAAGPLIGKVAQLVGAEPPVHSEAHHKLSFRDSKTTVPRDAPMLIWCDPQRIRWSDEERDLLAEAGRPDLAGLMPGFCHGRPEGSEESPWILALWEYERTVTEPVWPMPEDDMYAEVVIRGMATMVPSIAEYLDHMPQPFVDGGYYTKAPDNKPLIGAIGPGGSYVCGAISGYGVMAAAAAGELAAHCVLGTSAPIDPTPFEPARFDDPDYVATITGADAGQL
ncbi:MAG: FAD-binding oxidoreductase [Acidimicrobiia bacterium]|nr:FAD-binding oxidoreductase [Acidimicrobiia bacterium]MDH4306180.1 FAD-binding oxidoreductase [Acidimicrobiia bacterium]MDH5292983.1 FAD-binding oxidoreductase [Acidimicrobiia bacterium]